MSNRLHCLIFITEEPFQPLDRIALGQLQRREEHFEIRQLCFHDPFLHRNVISEE